MKYGELVQFDPVESVKVLVEADDLDQSKEDVRTFVISDRMADQLIHVIFPNLQFDDPTDQRGLLIVANYGTGKTHLMSVISGVAERPELRDLLTHDQVKEHAGSVAGRFQVIRAEIGASSAVRNWGTSMRLRQMHGFPKPALSSHRRQRTHLV